MTAALDNLKFHHLGLAVKDDAKALLMLQALGYKIGERVYDPKQNVFVRLSSAAAHPAVEIVQPGDKGKSPVDGLVTRYEELIYHTCYETPDLAETLSSLEKTGLRCMPLTERIPAILFGGRHVSFYKIPGWGIIELLEDK